MFDKEINENFGSEYSEFFGRKARSRRQERTQKREARRANLSPEKRERRRKRRKAAGFLPPVALYRLGRRAVTGRKFNDFDGENINGLDI